MLLEGGQFTTIQAEEQHNGPGDGFLVPPGVTHAHRYFQDEIDIGILVRFRLSKVSQSGNCEKVADRVIKVLSTPHTRSLHDQKLTDMLTADDGETNVEHLRLKMIGWLMRLYMLYEKDMVAPPKKRQLLPISEKLMVERVCTTIFTLCMKDINVRDIAAFHNISYRHLSRIFYKRTGYTLTRFIALTRVRNALPLLTDSELPIQEISTRCGFHSESYFSNVFTKLCDMPPTIYRLESRKSPFLPEQVRRLEQKLHAFSATVLNYRPSAPIAPSVENADASAAPALNGQNIEKGARA